MRNLIATISILMAIRSVILWLWATIGNLCYCNDEREANKAKLLALEA